MSKDATKIGTEADHEKRPICADAVPRVLHQVWVQGEPSEEAAKFIGRAQSVCERDDWAHMLWHADDSRIESELGIVELEPGWCREAWARCSSVSDKSDLIRFAVLDAFGGLYLDADVDLFRLPEGLRGAHIMGTIGRVRWKRAPMVNCAAFAAPPGHAYLGRVKAWIQRRPEWFAECRYAGMLPVQECLGPDVTVWPFKAWNGPAATYGNHLYRAPTWGSQILTG